jgi:hypothetical protein
MNGLKITQPTAVAVGSSIQFGSGGPVLRVVWFGEDAPKQFQRQQQSHQAQMPPEAGLQTYSRRRQNLRSRLKRRSLILLARILRQCRLRSQSKAFGSDANRTATS